MKGEDFGDGGAYPEIHMIQYPLNMGKPGQKSTAVIPVQLSEDGALRTDLLVKQGTNTHLIVQTRMADIKEKRLTRDEMALPDEAEEIATAERTRQALEALTNSKVRSSKPASSALTSSTEVEPAYIRYQSKEGSERVIKMVEAQVDPMEPPKHANMKVPRAPSSAPVPILHSPPRKLTIEDQQAWKIPPCVSNWKNARGFIIPLDKRLAADGRGLGEASINNKFATFAEAMYMAERVAVKDLQTRNDLRKATALRSKEDREAELRAMANQARAERSGAIQQQSSVLPDYQSDNSGSEGSGSDGEGEDDGIGRQQRERIRLNRRREREDQLRIENMKGNMRQNKLGRDQNRDVSEKIALGMLKGTGKMEGEGAFDNRLFNQSAGMQQGFGTEDDYNVYARPLFDRGEASSIYRPKADGEIYGEAEADAAYAKLADTSRFKADKGFQGADGGRGGGKGREAPVQFEKVAEADPYRPRAERRHSPSPPRRNKRSRHDDD